MASPDDYLALRTPGTCGRIELRGIEFRALDFGGLDFRGLMARLRELRSAWAERMRQRQALAALDDRMLKDIGLDRAVVSREEAKLFWRP